MKRQPLSAQGIVAAAIRIADAEGLDAVSIRRVAAELDGRAMSLYNHFASKDDLLSAMADEVVGEMLVTKPLPDDWRDAVAATARGMFAAFVAHPWLIFAFAGNSKPGGNAVKLAKQMARGVGDLELEQGDIWNLLGIVNDYVTGYAFRTVTSANPEEMEVAIAASDVVEFPELAALPDNIRARVSPERFDLGLQVVLDGVERRFLER